ncbi:hypothetical protein PG990_002408 [Apiospora arundinis]
MVSISKSLVADICVGSSPPTVRFVTLLENHDISNTTSPSLSGVLVQHGSSLQGPAGLQHVGLAQDQKYQHALTKGLKAVEKLQHFLDGPAPMSGDPVVLRCSSARSSTLLEITDETITSGPPCAGAAREREGITSFHRMKFHLPKHVGCVQDVHETSSQMLHLSCDGLRSEDTLFDRFGRWSRDHVTIVSGMCLFSDKIMRDAVKGDGKLDVSKLSSQEPTLYELEIIARSSSAIADVASHILGKNPAAKPIPLEIVLDAPSWHYFQVVHGNLASGHCTPAEALDWLQAVELRCEQVTTVFENSVRHEMGLRGVPAGFYHILTAPGTAGVGTSIRQALTSGMVPDIADCMDAICEVEGERWAMFYSLIPEKDRPCDFRSLGNLFYIYEVVRPALAAKNGSTAAELEVSGPNAALDDSSSSGHSDILDSALHLKVNVERPLIMSIDDRAERKIYSKAQAFIKKIRRAPQIPSHPLLLELYSARRVFINGNTGGDSLYWNDSSSHPLRMNTTAGSPELEAFGVIRNLYGNDCAQNLQRWFLEAGVNASGHT